VFLGRTDNQIKIRGFRVAAEEIEAALREHPDVVEAVVQRHRRADGQTQLRAYLVSGPTVPTSAGMVAFLADRLPAHLRPQRLLLLERLPRNHNGKLDRAAMTAAPARELTSVHIGVDGGSDAGGPVESALARIWREVLEIEQVSADDDFFALGGDSLLLYDVLARARSAGIPVSYDEAMLAPTIRALARAAATTTTVTTATATTVTATTVTVRDGESDAFALSPPQEWLFSLDHPDRHHWNQARLLSLRPGVDPGRLRDAVERMVDRHAALRLRFGPPGDGHRQQYRPAAAVSVHSRSDLSGLRDDAVPAALAAVADEVNLGLDLAAGIPFRAAQLDLGPDRPGRLLLVGHQLVVDGLSWRILLADLQRTVSGSAAEDGLSPYSYRDWVVQLGQRAASPELLAQAPYWSSLGRPEVGPTQLPSAVTDVPGASAEPGGNRAADSAVVELELSTSDTAELLRRARTAGGPGVEDTLLAGLSVALAGWLDAAEVLVDVGGLGRRPVGGVDVSATVGWFISQSPVPLPLRPGAPVAGVVEAVVAARAAAPGDGHDYGLLRYLGPADVRRSLAAAPRAWISFNHVGTTGEPLPPGVVTGRAPEAPGATLSDRAERPHLIEVGSALRDGRLGVVWTYNRTVHTGQTIGGLAAAQLDAVRRLLARAGP
jgi:non-ribosomal peptide synthase protein (TIGR01720 family)